MLYSNTNQVSGGQFQVTAYDDTVYLDPSETINISANFGGNSNWDVYEGSYTAGAAPSLSSFTSDEGTLPYTYNFQTGFSDFTVYVVYNSGTVLNYMYKLLVINGVQTQEPIGLLGTAIAPFDWSVDQDLTSTDNVNYTGSFDLVVGGLKFRSNNSWEVNWGVASFPNGVGTQDGANIPVNQAGYYDVAFNKSTGAYSFAFHDCLNHKYK